MESEESTVIKGNWAESLEKILSEEQPKHKKYLVLSKFKEAKAKPKPENHGFEIEGEIKEKKDNKAVSEKILKANANRLQRKQKFELFKGLRVKPEIKDKNREMALKKIATRGVVQLFNAVQAQQIDLTKKVESEKLDHKRDEILNNINKRAFLNVLMGPNAKSELVDNPPKKEKKESDSDSDDEPATNGTGKESTWNVLKDNFMFPNKKATKNWDQEESDDEDDMGNESS